MKSSLSASEVVEDRGETCGRTEHEHGTQVGQQLGQEWGSSCRRRRLRRCRHWESPKVGEQGPDTQREQERLKAPA
jgi:hypothetical protein